jgi:hypothetical protein
MPPPVGFEQDGRGDESLRQILVLRKFNNQVVWVLPLTRRNKPGNPYYVAFDYSTFPEIEERARATATAISVPNADSARRCADLVTEAFDVEQGQLR